MSKIACPQCGAKYRVASGVLSAYWQRCNCGIEFQVTPGFWKATVTNWRLLHD